MFGSATFDLVIGMVFVFLMLSLVVSAVREAIEARLKARAKHLAHGLFELLGSERLVQRLYEHPLIYALYDGKYDGSVIHYKGHKFFSWLPALIASLKGSSNMPSYIPARTFALAIVDLARNQKLAGQDGAAPPIPVAGPPSGQPYTLIDDLRAALNAQAPNAPVAKALLAAIAPVGSDVDKGLAAIQNWFDSSMDRASGWFKRDSQHILFWLGIVVAVALNVDSIYLTKFLAANSEARARLVTVATQTAADNSVSEKIDQLRLAPAASPPSQEPEKQGPEPQTVAQLRKNLAAADVKVSNAIAAVTDLNLPLGWNHTRWNDFKVADSKTLQTILGWIITGFALSFGAPFWFDLLNQLMVIRSTVKPHEKSQEESSQDRQKP